MSGRRYRKKQLIPNQQGNSPSITVQRSEYSFSGPLPPPEILERYNQAIPNGAERILAMAERQSAHRESLEQKVVATNAFSQKAGSVFAFIISLVTISGGIWLIHEGKSVSGLVAIIANLVALAGVFVYSRHKQGRERVEKAAALAQRRSN